MRCGPSFLARYIIVSQQEGLAYRVLRLLLRFGLLDDDLETIAGRWEKVTDVLWWNSWSCFVRPPIGWIQEQCVLVCIELNFRCNPSVLTTRRYASNSLRSI